MKRRENIIILVVWMFVLITPYIIGFLLNNQKVEFLGFLLNPIDGLSYLAKMNQGANGEWLFHLPYSADNHQRVFLFSFYLLIGKISTVLPGSMIFGFHFFRICCALFFYYQLVLFADEYFDSGFIQKYLKIGVLFGGGMGWLYLFSGDIPADFWVAEAFPFLSAFVNPHFILSLGLLLYIVRIINRDVLMVKDYLYLGLVAIVLANISPFSVVIGGLILFSAFLWEVIFVRKIKPLKMIIFGFGAGPIMLYQYWVVNTIDTLISWNSQNITPAPSPFNFIFSFSPFLILVIGLIFLIKGKKVSLTKLQFVLLFWAVLAAILIYLPLDLQRRFMVGYYLAIVLLFFSLFSSAIQANLLPNHKIKRYLFILMMIILPSNIFLITGAVGAVIQKNENLYIPSSLVQTYQWLYDNGKANDVVLTEESIGLSLPAYTHQRVVVGHPFETPNYEIVSKKVESFFYGSLQENPNQFLINHHIDYVLFSKDQRETISDSINELDVCYENNEYVIYSVKH